MGLVLVVYALGSLVVSTSIGSIGYRIHRRARADGRGSWPLYFLVGLAAAALCGIAGSILVDVDGRPGEPDWERIVNGVILLCASPGVFLAAGAVASRYTPRSAKR